MQEVYDFMSKPQNAILGGHVHAMFYTTKAITGRTKKTPLIFLLQIPWHSHNTAKVLGQTDLGFAYIFSFN